MSEALEAGSGLPEPPRGGRRLFHAVALVADAMLVVMLAAILFQVGARYVFASPPFWTEELARYAMIWCGSLGAALAFWHGVDPRFVEEGVVLRGRARPFGTALALVPAAVFAGVLLYQSLFGPNGAPARGFMARNLSRLSEGLEVNMAWVAAAIPAMAALILVAALLHLAALLRAVAAARPRRPS